MRPSRSQPSDRGHSLMTMRITRSSFRMSGNNEISHDADISDLTFQSLENRLNTSSIHISPKSSPSVEVHQSLLNSRKRGRPGKEKLENLVDSSGNPENLSLNRLNVSVAKIPPDECGSYYKEQTFNKPSNCSSSSDDSVVHYVRKLRPRRSGSNYCSTERRPLHRSSKFRRVRCEVSISNNNNTSQGSYSTDGKSYPNSVTFRDDHNDAILDEDDEEDQGDNDEQRTRRYPVRNRRNTTVYQVENPQNNHNNNPPQQQRNWMAGTGYDKHRRSRRFRSKYRKNLDHRGSSTSSSSSDSDGSLCVRSPIRRGWDRLYYSAKENNGPVTAVDDDEKRFERRVNKSIMHARSELMPINKHQLGFRNKSTVDDRLMGESCLGDIQPMSIDSSVGFQQIGGHEQHILALRESIILPLMYPEVFSKFNVDPPRGVLFSGPPGTGKTLLARALANECSRLAEDNNGSGKRRAIAFFMRKGADCLSKWVGESERQLRLLFDQAYRMRPSVIFFDEIDGLAPVRSSKQDQIHSSIVSTLLSLMDGLDNRAEVVVIGATNRPDAIDPALRRPGRFDREFIFTLPSEAVRRQILGVITSKWDSKPDSLLLDQIAATTTNFSGADLKALTTEACLCCLRRCYPQVYKSHVKLALEYKYLVVSHCDWFEALQIVRASSERSDADAAASCLTPSANALAATLRTPLSPNLAKLLIRNVDIIVNYLSRALFDPRKQINPTDHFKSSRYSANDISSCIFKSKLFINGNVSDIIMNAVWHKLETLQVFTINLANLFAFPASIGMCPEAAVAQIISSIRHALNNSSTLSFRNNSQMNGVVVYLPSVDSLFKSIPQLTGRYLIDRLNALVDEVNCELNYIPSALITSEYDGASYDNDNTSRSDVDNRKLSYAAVKNPRRIVIIGTCKHQNYKSVPPRIVTPNIEKRIPSVRQPNLSPNSTNTLRENCVTLFNTPTEKLQEGKCQLVNGINLSDRSPSSPSSIHSRYSPKFSLPTLRTGNTVSVNEPAIKYSYDRDAENIKLQININLSECRKSSKTSNVHHSPLVNSDLNPCESNTDNIHNNSLNVDLSDDCQKTLDSPNSNNSFYVNHMLNKIFDINHTEFINLEPPNRDERLAFFTPVLITWPQLTHTQLLDIRDKSAQPHGTSIPSPPPAVENEQNSRKNTQQVNFTPEELAIIESRETQLFRRLRQVLRRVVAHLASFRRFAVFTRPVQLEEAPDYYDVIKQPMDLGVIRDKIDTHQYNNVNDFMKDVELIYRNALEYNPPNIPRSRDIRSRASEFWDEACIRVEEELQPPDLNELCEEANLARAARMSSISNQKNKETEPHSAIETNEKSQKNITKQPLPLPQGDRYSRRLHGKFHN
uniref:Bromo domain-containing protein n=1 Tax=Trichobilharzia regenti TaxID=157069 RepID=A0AA85J2Q1_TRIRE|nr:unnamed protein product [Trichobilharzia regenti]